MGLCQVVSGELARSKGLQETDGRVEAAGSGGAHPATARTGQVAPPALRTVSLLPRAQARAQRPRLCPAPRLQRDTSRVAVAPAACFLRPEAPRSNERTSVRTGARSSYLQRGGALRLQSTPPGDCDGDGGRRGVRAGGPRTAVQCPPAGASCPLEVQVSDGVYWGCEDSSEGGTAVKRVDRRQTADARAASSASPTRGASRSRLPGRDPAAGPAAFWVPRRGDGITNLLVSETSIALCNKI